MQGRVVLCAKPECASAKPGVAGARAVSCMCKVCACKCRERNRECKGKSCGLRSGRLSPRLGQFSRPFRAKMFLIILRSQGGARKARLPWAVLANGVVARTHPLTRVVLTSSLREGCSSSEGQEVMGGQRGTLRPSPQSPPRGRGGKPNCSLLTAHSSGRKAALLHQRLDLWIAAAEVAIGFRRIDRVAD